MSRRVENLVSVNHLAASTIFTSTGLAWRFPTVEAARQHLRKYEKLIAHWSAALGASDAVVSGGGKEWPVLPHLSPDLNPEISPIAAAPTFRADGDLLIAQHWLNAPLLDVLLELRQTPGIAGLVSWESQKQVVLTQACEELTLGEQLSDSLKYSRQDYWHRPDFERFQRECRQALNQDGSNSIEFRYQAFDPKSGGRWKDIVASYRFIDAHHLGLFQLAHNRSYRPISAPVSA